MTFVCAGTVHCSYFERCSTRYSNPVRPDVWNAVPLSFHSWFSSNSILSSRDQKFQGLYRPACIFPARELWKEKGLCFWFDSRFICNPLFNRFRLTPLCVKYGRNGLTKRQWPVLRRSSSQDSEPAPLQYSKWKTSIGERRGAYRVLVGKPEGKRPLRRPRCSREENIKIDI